MSHILISTNDRPWLKETHQKRSKRSFELGKQTIDLLLKKDVPVTYANIAEWSKKLDTEGKGIHSNTIRTNQELYEYYKEHSRTFKLKTNSKNVKRNRSVTVEYDFRKINPDRNEINTLRKHMKLSKQELAQRLFQAEQYIAKNHTNWVAKHFEMFK